MIDMKCPFCQQELEVVFEQVGHSLEEAYLLCNKCNLRAERKLWQELDRTKKQLELALSGLQKIADAPIGYCLYAEETLDQINNIDKGE